MGVNSSFDLVSFADVRPGQFVSLGPEKDGVKALSVLRAGHDVGFLLLEGPDVGTVKYISDCVVSRPNNQADLNLRYLTDSLSDEMPNVKLAAAKDDKYAYFIFIDQGVPMAAHSSTGDLSVAPKGLRYVNNWTIGSRMETESFLQSKYF